MPLINMNSTKITTGTVEYLVPLRVPYQDIRHFVEAIHYGNARVNPSCYVFLYLSTLTTKVINVHNKSIFFSTFIGTVPIDKTLPRDFYLSISTLTIKVSAIYKQDSKLRTIHHIFEEGRIKFLTTFHLTSSLLLLIPFLPPIYLFPSI